MVGSGGSVGSMVGSGRSVGSMVGSGGVYEVWLEVGTGLSGCAVASGAL